MGFGLYYSFPAEIFWVVYFFLIGWTVLFLLFYSVFENIITDSHKFYWSAAIEAYYIKHHCSDQSCNF